MRDPFRERDTRVSRKGEEVSRDGGKIADVRDVENHNYSGEECSDPANTHSLLENVDHWIGGRIIQGSVEVRHGPAEYA